MLETRDLVKHYRVGLETVRAVESVSLSIDAGQFVALYGPSGSGKSTLLDLVAGFQAPDSGQVIIDGRDIATFSEREHAEYLRNVVGIIGDLSELMPAASARENAALKLLRGDPRHATRLVEPLLEELGLGARMDQPVNKLSMGERQRVMIARALATQPRLVLADEPTGNLDTRRSREILDQLRVLCRSRDMAVLLATHDPQAVGFADCAYELRDGRLHEYSPEDVFVRPGEAPSQAG
ncbi:MAG: ABC transporter ATP-binding protein [Solirubrobacterales bacterium]|nr:ABC transporter ATP-binding protein [Solirubrobacterales bacterium]